MNFESIAHKRKKDSSYMPGRYSATEYMNLSSYLTNYWREPQPVNQPEDLSVGNVPVGMLSSYVLATNLNHPFENETGVLEGDSYSSEKPSIFGGIQMLEEVRIPCEGKSTCDSNCVGRPSTQKQKYEQKFVDILAFQRDEVKAGDFRGDLQQQQFDIKPQIRSAQSPLSDCSQPQHSASSQCSHQRCRLHVSPIFEDARLMNSSSSTIEEETSSQCHNSSTSGYLSANLLDVQPATLDHLPSVADQTADQLWFGTNTTRDRKKRKRTRPCKNSEEVESQRMTHIAVERNRRKQMNEHLGVLRSLMPESYVQRGDQASIIGGAIEFVKELEEILHSLQAQKWKINSEDGNLSPHATESLITDLNLNPFWSFDNSESDTLYANDNFFEPSKKLISLANSPVVDVEVKIIGQGAAEVKVLLQKRHGQLLKIISVMESLHLAIMHLNITTIEQTVLYTFNVKMEADCEFQTGSELSIILRHLIHANSVDNNN